MAADKGYHANDQLTDCDHFGLRTYIPEPNSPHNRKWTDKSEQTKRAVLNNRRRMSRPKGKELQKLRSEKVERSFAHVCETGGARRLWLRGLEKIEKHYQLVVAAHNLGIIMRNLFGSGKPRGMGTFGQLCFTIGAAIRNAITMTITGSLLKSPRPLNLNSHRQNHNPSNSTPKPIYSTGC